MNVELNSRERKGEEGTPLTILSSPFGKTLGVKKKKGEGNKESPAVFSSTLITTNCRGGPSRNRKLKQKWFFNRLQERKRRKERSATKGAGAPGLRSRDSERKLQKKGFLPGKGGARTSHVLVSQKKEGASMISGGLGEQERKGKNTRGGGEAAL